MMCEKLQHVIKETDSSRNLVPALSFNDQHRADVGFPGGALDRGFSHFAVASFAPISESVSRSACSKRAVCSVVPSEMRTQPSQPWSRERSRTRMPRWRIVWMNGVFNGPSFVRTKLAWLVQ